jgi:hypothetical protein
VTKMETMSIGIQRGRADEQIELIAVLRDLVAALDRRIPRMGRAGEESIARDSAALRSKALDRIAQLTND